MGRQRAAVLRKPGQLRGLHLSTIIIIVTITIITITITISLITIIISIITAAKYIIFPR